MKEPLRSKLDERVWTGEAAPAGVLPFPNVLPSQYVSPPLRGSSATRRCAFTGALGAGKDWVAERWGLTRVGFADPLYAFAQHFLGSSDKATPGVRKFLQDVGQWGRGLVSDGYPLTAVRRLTMLEAQEFFGSHPEWRVDDSLLGRDPDVWVRALVTRVGSWSGRSVGVTNARFQNELDALKAAGFSLYHVACSPSSLTERRAKAGYGGYDPALFLDISEQLAMSIDARLARGEGPPEGITVVWNDDIGLLPPNYGLVQMP